VPANRNKPPRAPDRPADIDAAFSIALSAFGILIAFIQADRLRWVIIVLLSAVILSAIVRTFVKPVGELFVTYARPIVAALVLSMAAIFGYSEYLRAVSVPYDAIDKISYERQLFDDQALPSNEALLSSDDFFKTLQEQSRFFKSESNSMAVPLAINLSVGIRETTSFSTYSKLMGSLSDQTEFAYAFKYRGRYYVIDASNENQNLAFSFRSGRCYLYLKFDFKDFLNESVRADEAMEKIDFKESLLVFVLKDQKYHRKFKGGGFRETIEKAAIGDIEDLKRAIYALHVNVDIVRP
jgi:hypothetical protein